MLMALFMISCASPKATTTDGQQTKAFAVAATPMGLQMEEVKAGERVVRLEQPGDEVELKMGERVGMIIADIDPRNEIVETIIDDERGTIKLCVKDARQNVVTLTKKCQTIERVGTGPLPSIELQEGLHPEQVVITPMCDESQQVVGYSIRYGSEERGCKSEARAALRAFARCHDSQPSRKKSPKSVDAWKVLFQGKR